MSLPIVFRQAARAEFDEAVEWYEKHRVGLGGKFYSAVEQLLQQIADHPDLYPIARGDVREALVSGFPYCVYYHMEPDQTVILAVFHTSRDPAIWQNRIP